MDNWPNTTLFESLTRLQHPKSTAPIVEGRVSRAIGLTIEARGFQQPLGARCYVHLGKGKKIQAEVVGFDEQACYLMPVEATSGLAPGMCITPTGRLADVAVGEALRGRILDANGHPLDGKPRPYLKHSVPINSLPFNPLQRAAIDRPLDVGIKAINGLLTVGRGQRMGLFAGSGVGKSVLLSMMTRNTTADIVVVGLIGERGREVQEFIEANLGEEGLARAVIVAAPADESALMRLNGALMTTAIAEYYRDQGLHVLLLMDSLTRFAQAQREIGLSIGEPPASKGYPPSVFAKLPKLVERAGNGKPGGGSITAFYTVLTEGDDQQDPIADSARAVLDGHIVLSRELAESGQYPAIDLEASISRVMPAIVEPARLKQTLVLKKYLSLYEKNKDLILLGAYQRGSDPNLDKAIALREGIRNFITQDMHSSVNIAQSYEALDALLVPLADELPL